MEATADAVTIWQRLSNHSCGVLGLCGPGAGKTKRDTTATWRICLANSSGKCSVEEDSAMNLGLVAISAISSSESLGAPMNDMIASALGWFLTARTNFRLESPPPAWYLGS